MFLIKTKAPLRVDLAGGTLDLWPIAHILDKKATVNFGVSLFAECATRPSESGQFIIESSEFPQPLQGSFQDVIRSDTLPLIRLLLAELWEEKLPPLRIKTRSDSPPGAGLGGSSALLVAVAANLWRTRQLFDNSPDLSESELVQRVQNIEARLIHAPTGCQDYWGAVRGNVNILTYPFAGLSVETLDHQTFRSLNDFLILCYSGKSRASADNNWNVYKGFFDRKKDLIHLLQSLGEQAWLCAQAVKNNRWSEALDASKCEWTIRKKLWRDIETPETMALDQAAQANGALFTRLCGAGGGGVMSIFCPPEHQQRVHDALRNLGGVILPAQITNQGLQTKCEKSV